MRNTTTTGVIATGVVRQIDTRLLSLFGWALAILACASTAWCETQQVDQPTRICTVKLHGNVGGLHDGTPLKTFDAELLEKCLRRALREKASAIILDIETPGGRTDEMQDICRKLVEYHDKLRIVAWVGDGLSAGAVITLTCKEVVTKPITRIGAALIYFVDADGNRVMLDEKRRKDAYYQKLASVYQAADREFMAASGHPVELIEAMTIQTAELWWSPSQQRLSRRRPSGFQGRNDWEQLDDHETVLTLTGEEAVQLGVAAGMAPTVKDIPQLLDIGGPVEAVDLSHIVIRHNADINRRIKAFYKNANRHLKALYEIQNEMNFMPRVDWNIPPSKRHLATAEVRGRLRKISNSAAQCRSAVAALRRIDRLLIERRIQALGQPEVLAQMDFDVMALGEVREMLDGYMRHDLQGAQAWIEAEAWVKTSREAWSQITGD